MINCWLTRHTILLLADTGDWSDGITITLISVNEVPPSNNKVTEMLPEDSEAVKVDEENCTVNAVNYRYTYNYN